ncbi:MAG: aminotransferase class III-fold pyridoxal phosphate-dependent enzyme, partial [bacterium]
VTPDLLVLGKGMTSGYVPIAAVAIAASLYGPLSAHSFPFNLTNDGHPLAMAAGLAVLDELVSNDIFQVVRARGSYLQAELTSAIGDLSSVVRIRGAGLMLGIELQSEHGEPWQYWPGLETLRLDLEERGLLISTGRSAIILAPPLIISEEECLEIVQIVKSALEAI